MASLKELNRALKAHDSNLYVVEHRLGRYDVYRKSSMGLDAPNFVFSLTDTWQPTGRPVPYGIEVVLSRLKAIDLWRDDSFVENWIKEHQAHVETQERKVRNNIESFLYDFRSQFHKVTSDINTSNLKKLYRKEDSHAYCEPRS